MAQPQNRNGDKKMNGLIKTPGLGNVGTLGSLAIAFCSLSAVLYVMLSGVSFV